MFCKKLEPTKQKFNKKKIYGFDIETYDNNKKFYCETLYLDDKNYWTFFDKQKLINFFKTKRFRSSYIVATNLSFDFWGVLFDKKESQAFFTLARGSDLISAKTRVYKGEFQFKPQRGSHTLTFIDTLNYAKLSVEDMGNILKLPKLQKPKALGKLPKDDKERKELITYNIRDAQISKTFTEFLFDGFEELGATPKMTIASTSLNLFTSKYLKQTYWRHNKEDLLFQFKGYYGGRTEVFSRGKIENYNYYDFNSLYPSVMRDCIYPDPNSKRITYANNLDYINKYEGFSEVNVSVPSMDYPILPLKHDNKLIFPTGSFKGVWTHNELRYAIENGVTITKVHKTMYFKENCKPFETFADELYNKRLEYKKKGSKMQLVTKLLMNSLSGKFGQKFENKEMMLPLDIPIEEIRKYKNIERVGNYFRVVSDAEPSRFCIPCWSAYVTSHARIKLHKAMKQCHPIYVDTDSLVTNKRMIDGSNLGELELEYTIKKGVFVKPKFYAFTDINNKSVVKLKGMGRKLSIEEFNKLLNNPVAVFNKFVKFKEALRRHLTPNEIIEVRKEYSLEDNKREWKEEFNKNTLEHSKPRELNLLIEEHKYLNIQEEYKTECSLKN